MFGGHFDEESDSFLKFKSVVKQLDKFLIKIKIRKYC